MTEEIEACPECDSPSFEVNAKTSHVGRPGTSQKYRCKDCNATFDGPVTRERRGKTRLKGLAKKLHEHTEQELSDEWRYRCPNGHASVTVHRATFYCRACEQTRPKADLRDMATE